MTDRPDMIKVSEESPEIAPLRKIVIVVFATIFFSTNDGIARLTLNRPKRPNSFTVQMHREVAEALNMLEAAPEVHALLITGAGRGFCAGQDLFDRAVVPGQAVDLGDSVERLYNPLIRRLVALPFPVVCAVNGVAWRRGPELLWRQTL
ncbi:enoyl-CoA hydratase-related protein [Acidiphilium acidophilum]|nr:enoyl-CoA hydratase-related protein [Acidiphilium acidophilum]